MKPAVLLHCVRIPGYLEETHAGLGNSLSTYYLIYIFQEYKLALFQCYGRYLEQFCSADIDEITDVETFKATFFPSGTDDKNAGLTVCLMFYIFNASTIDEF